MEIKYCDSLLSKAFGFMFSLKPDKVLVFRFGKEKIRSLHMFFVFCNLDVLFLDKNKRVVEIARLKPFTIYTPKHKSKYIVEMPESFIKKKRIKTGSKFLF